jgi:hypothetical protein
MTLWHQTTDAERAALTQSVITALAASAVPHHLRDGLVRYFSEGILPGVFLQAVLCNDLAQTVQRAADHVLVALPALVDFLRWTVPARAWGSREKVRAWTTTPDRLEL